MTLRPWGLLATLALSCPAKRTPTSADDKDAGGAVVETQAMARAAHDATRAPSVADADAIAVRLAGARGPTERRSLLRKLATIDRTRAVPLLRRAVGDESAEVRLGVARIVGQMRIGEVAADLAARLRIEPVPIVGAEMGTSLALLRDRAVAAGLVDLVDSTDADRRTAAARVVGVTLGSGAVHAATLARLDAALSASDVGSRRDAARVLKELRDARARQPLEKRLAVENDEMTIAVILNAIAATGDRASVPAVAKFIASLRTRGAIPPYHFVWQRAFAAVISLGGADADRFLRDASRWPEVQMTKELVEKLKPWVSLAR